MLQRQIAYRIKALRRERGLTQAAFGRQTGIGSARTISSIEAGRRPMASNEVLCVVQRLEVPLEYFTDPLRVDGEARFSWCHQGGHGAALSAFEQKAGSWVGAYRLWRRRCGQPGSTLRPSLALTRSSRPEDAAEAGERLIAEWSLEPASATELTRAIQERLKALVLMVDAPVGVSFGTCQLNDLDAILIDRNASVGRRNANLAHALFRVLTSEACNAPPMQASRTSVTLHPVANEARERGALAAGRNGLLWRLGVH